MEGTEAIKIDIIDPERQEPRSVSSHRLQRLMAGNVMMMNSCLILQAYSYLADSTSILVFG